MTMPGTALEYPVRVLFLCTGNSARSQIAEALLRKKGGDRFIVGSPGANPAADIRPEAITALGSLGIDWSKHKPKGYDAVAGTQWDIVITLCDRVKESCPALPTRPVTAHWGVPDPSEINDARRRQTAFSETVALLSWRIDLMLALRIDQFESWVLEQRLRGIATETAPRSAAPTATDPHTTQLR